MEHSYIKYFECNIDKTIFDVKKECIKYIINKHNKTNEESKTYITMVEVKSKVECFICFTCLTYFHFLSFPSPLGISEQL